MSTLRMDFMTLLLSFRHTAFELLEGSEDAPRDLDAARVQRELLAVLEDKTRGNLTAEESRMMEAVLRELDEALQAATQL